MSGSLRPLRPCVLWSYAIEVFGVGLDGAWEGSHASPISGKKFWL